VSPLPNSTVTIRLASHKDLEKIQEVHEAAFDGFFLTRMGGRFIHEYYSTVLEYSRGQIFSAWEGNNILGFASVLIDPNSFYGFMASRRKKFIIPTLIGIIQHPVLLPRVIFNRSRVMNYSVESDISSARLCELVSIGVLPNTGKKGIGKKLMEAVREFATEEGAYEILLTTDSQNNEVVNRFYLKLNSGNPSQ